MLDRGFEFYAPQTMLDAKGRRILIAWMGVPGQDEDKHPTIAHRWIHALTLPRELKLKNGKLYQTPVEELQMLRKDKIAYSNVTIANEEMMLEGISGDVIELNLENIRLLGGIMEIAIRNTARIIYNSGERVLTLERKSFANGLTEKRQCRLERLHSLHMFLDTSSIEVFVNEGEEVFTARFFPYKNNQTISFAANGHLVFDIQKWSL